MRTEKAISDLAHIRQRLQLIDARSAFRSFSLVISTAVFVVAAMLQPAFQIDSSSATGFVSYWLVIALACSLGIAVEVWWRSVSQQSRITFEWSRQLAVAMMPALSVSALATWAVMGSESVAPMLPGLWAIFGGLALASAARLLPSLCQISAFWLIVGGALAIRFHELFGQYPSLTMILLFGAGQLLLAICLFAGVDADG